MNIIETVIKAFQRQWKVFLLSLVGQLVIVVLLHLGVQTPQILKFLTIPDFYTQVDSLTTPLAPELSIWRNILLKLDRKPNNFELYKETSLIPVAYASDQTPLNSQLEESKAYVVIDYDTGQVSFSKNAQVRLPVASVTKIMTAVVALDLAEPDERFTISQHAAEIEPTKIGVIAGESMDLNELLSALLLTSANDAAPVTAEGIDQKYQDNVFIKAMNEKARVLGLKDTQFANPQGFDNLNNFSSAEDLAVLSHYALTSYPEIAEIAKKDYQFIGADNYHKQFDLYNWNGLLGIYPGVFGLKIGYTDDAGHTTVVVSERGGKKVLVVLLGAPTTLSRDLWASQLLDLGFGKFNLPPINITQRQLQTKYATWKYWQ